MAISTAGFQIRNMPRYTAPDPSLVAFNPADATNGVLSSFQLAQLLDKVKEQRATANARIQAQNAQNALISAQSNASLPLVAPKAGLELAQIGAQTSLLPKQTLLEEGKIGQDLALLNPVTDLKLAQAATNMAIAKTDLGMLPQKAALEVKKMDSDLATLEDAESLRSKQLALAKQTLNYKLSNAVTDADREAALKESQAAENFANAKHLEAQAKYLEAGGRQLAEKDPATQIGALQMAAKRLEDSYQLAAYETELAAGNKILPNGGIFGVGAFKPKRDASKDKAIEIRDKYYSTINSLVKKWADKITTEALQPVNNGNVDVNNGAAHQAPDLNKPANAVTQPNGTGAPVNTLPPGSTIFVRENGKVIKTTTK